MPHDALTDEVEAWLSRARSDLRAATVGLEADPPLLDDAAFHSQQAVEKALKALLTFHSHPFRKTHDLGELGFACLDHEPDLEDLLKEAAPLTEYSWRFRYPSEPIELDRREVEDALRLAQKIVEAAGDAAGR